MVKRRRKTRTHVEPEAETLADIPKSFIVRNGKVNGSVARLIKDLRRMMEPNTAYRLRERKNAKVKDYIHVAAQLMVTHCLVLSQSDTDVKLKLGRIPRGPSLTFSVKSYSLIKDVLGMQRRPRAPSPNILVNPPLLVLNNFQVPSSHHLQSHMALLSTVFQNLVPPISVSTVKLSQAKRVVLVNYDRDGDVFEIRHYTINTVATDVSKSVKTLIHAKVPNLHNYKDISDYVLREATTTASESEVEEGEKVSLLPQEPSMEAEKRAIKLVELGPRLTLKLLKVESGLFGQKDTNSQVLFESLN